MVVIARRAPGRMIQRLLTLIYIMRLCPSSRPDDDDDDVYYYISPACPQARLPAVEASGQCQQRELAHEQTAAPSQRVLCRP